MVNFERNPSKIIEAHKSGLISDLHFGAWLGAHQYGNELKKSFEMNCISKSTLQEEVAKISGLHFQKDQSNGTLRFILKGEFDPINLIKQNDIIKSIQSKPVQTPVHRREPVRVDDSIKKMVSTVDNFVLDVKRMTEAMKRRK